MALPTAQLGSMTTLNVPTGRGVVVKPTPLWQQALMQILAGTVGDIAKTGVSNVMSRDYATEAGQTPAGTWDRLLHGPQVSEADIRQMRTEKGAEGRLAKELTSREALARMSEEGANARQKSSQEFTGSENQKGREFTAGEGEKSREFSAYESEAQREAAALLAGQSEAAAERRLREQIAAEAPTREALAGHYNAQTAQINQLLETMKQLTAGKTPGTPTTTTPPTPFDERQAAIQKMLDQGIPMPAIIKSLETNPEERQTVTPLAPNDVYETMRNLLDIKNTQQSLTRRLPGGI